MTPSRAPKRSETKAKAKPLSFVVPTLADVSRFFDVRSDTISKYWLDSGMPGTPGHYDLKAIYDWKIQREKDPSHQAEVRADANEVRARRQLALAMKTEEDAAMKRFKRLQMEGEYWHRDEVRITNSTVMVRFRSRLMALGGQLAMLAPAETKAVTKQKAEQAVALALKEAYEAKVCGSTIEQMILDEAERIHAKRRGKDTGRHDDSRGSV